MLLSKRDKAFRIFRIFQRRGIPCLRWDTQFRKQRVGRPFFNGGNFYGNSQYVCNNLSPKLALRATAADTGGGDVQTALFCNFHTIFECECNPFHYGKRQMLPRCRRTDSDKRAFSINIVVGTSFTHKIGEEEDFVFTQKFVKFFLFFSIIVRF